MIVIYNQHDQGQKCWTTQAYLKGISDFPTPDFQCWFKNGAFPDPLMTSTFPWRVSTNFHWYLLIKFKFRFEWWWWKKNPLSLKRDMFVLCVRVGPTSWINDNIVSYTGIGNKLRPNQYCKRMNEAKKEAVQLLLALVVSWPVYKTIWIYIYINNTLSRMVYIWCVGPSIICR